MRSCKANRVTAGEFPSSCPRGSHSCPQQEQDQAVSGSRSEGSFESMRAGQRNMRQQVSADTVDVGVNRRPARGLAEMRFVILGSQEGAQAFESRVPWVQGTDALSVYMYIYAAPRGKSQKRPWTGGPPPRARVSTGFGLPPGACLKSALSSRSAVSRARGRCSLADTIFPRHL